MALAHAVQMGNALLAVNAKWSQEFVAPSAKTNQLGCASFTQNSNVLVATNADLDIAIKLATMMANRPNLGQIHPNN
jgi:hypothetical protein